MINFEKFELDNGLKVIVHQDKSTPIVAFNLLYDVGARDEDPSRTGFAPQFWSLPPPPAWYHLRTVACTAVCLWKCSVSLRLSSKCL